MQVHGELYEVQISIARVDVKPSADVKHAQVNRKCNIHVMVLKFYRRFLQSGYCQLWAGAHLLVRRPCNDHCSAICKPHDHHRLRAENADPRSAERSISVTPQAGEICATMASKCDADLLEILTIRLEQWR